MLGAFASDVSEDTALVTAFAMSGARSSGNCYDPRPQFSFSGLLISFPKTLLLTNPLSSHLIHHLIHHLTYHLTYHLTQVTPSQGVPRILLDCYVTLEAYWLNPFLSVLCYWFYRVIAAHSIFSNDSLLSVTPYDSPLSLTHQ